MPVWVQDPKPAQVITVAKSGGDYTSVATAIAAASGASATNPILIKICPGIYDEPPFTIPSYVTVAGDGPYATELRTTNNLAHFITGSPESGLSDMAIRGPSNAGFACINFETAGTSPFRVFDVELHSGYYGIWCHPLASGIMVIDEVFNYSHGLLHTFVYCSDRGILRGAVCAYRDDAAKGNTYGYRCDGANAQINLDACLYKDAAGTYGYYANNGAQMRTSACTISAAVTGLYVGPNGASKVDAIGMVIRPVVTNHIDVDSVTAEVLFSGTASQSKINVAAGASFVANFSDPAGGATEGTVNIGELYLGDATGNEIPVRDYLWYTASTALADGGEVTRNVGGGLKLDVAAGECFTSALPGTGVLEFYWNAVTLDMTDDSLSWIIVNNVGVVSESLATPDPRVSVVLAQVVTRSGQVVFLGKGTATQAFQPISELNEYRYLSNGPRALSGIATSANAAPLKIDIDGGNFYIGANKQTVLSGTAVTFTAWYRSAAPGNPWVAVTGQTLIDDEQFNDIAGGGGLVAIPGGESTGHVTYVVSTEAGAEYHVVYGQMTDLLVANITLPTPPDWLQYTAARSGMVVVLKSAGAITQINDERQFGLASGTSGGGGVTDHALLAGLAVGDDHPQYQLEAERDIALGYPTLTAAALLKQAQIPFTATAASNVTDGLPSAGAGTEVARQNHVHFHGNLAAVDGVLAALHSNAVAGVTPGFMSAADKTKLDLYPATRDYQTATSLARSTYNTDTTFQSKVALTTGALTGTYEVTWHCVLDGSATNQNVEVQLYNTTDAAIVGVVRVFRPTNSAERTTMGGFAEVTFTGAAKTFTMQYRTANTGSTVGIADARIKIVRVA